jgi:hypothetical protein
MATNPETRETFAAALAMDLDIGDPAPDIPEKTVEQLMPMLADLEAGRRALASLTQKTPSQAILAT